jgi:hypothetical protein
MKRLLEESTDELERELLEAGAEHRPSARNQATLLVALGVGGALGFLGSKTSTWLWTKAGKLTMLSVALCTVGAIYAVTRTSGLLEPTAPLAPALHAVDTVGSQAASVLEERFAPSGSPVSQTIGSARALVGSTAAVVPAKRLRQPAPNKPARSAVEPSSLAASERGGLNAEVQLVDALRVATAHKDWRAARQLIERHRVMFPEGQLGQEVADLAALEEVPAIR